jgi:hypothetical protein
LFFSVLSFHAILQSIIVIAKKEKAEPIDPAFLQ